MIRWLWGVLLAGVAGQRFLCLTHVSGEIFWGRDQLAAHLDLSSPTGWAYLSRREGEEIDTSRTRGKLLMQ